MGSMNRVFLMGNLTRDPELRHTPSGAPVADLAVAVNENYRDRDGREVESVCYVDVVAWNRQAETCAQYLHKGSPVLVEGKLQQDRWETADGQKRSRTRVRANRVQFLNNGRKDGKGAAKPVSGADPLLEERGDAADDAELAEADRPF